MDVRIFYVMLFWEHLQFFCKISCGFEVSLYNFAILLNESRPNFLPHFFYPSSFTECVALISPSFEKQRQTKVNKRLMICKIFHRVLKYSFLLFFQSKNLWQLSTEEIESSDLFYVPNLSDSIAPSSGNIYERLKSKAPIQESDSPVS